MSSNPKPPSTESTPESVSAIEEKSQAETSQTMSSNSKPPSSESTSEWVSAIEKKSQADTRSQPWKTAVGSQVADTKARGYNQHFEDDDKDLMAMFAQKRLDGAGGRPDDTPCQYCGAVGGCSCCEHCGAVGGCSCGPGGGPTVAG
ncbi:hypothetical protein BJ508DRAFT_360880 [Ascobolus immersus RN42]|uniref:Uncharacterized protein n=1 Tax=Ascobolus immersus RN42 TaxID=1160509 RepID=A0A3N4IFJ5_ASCIM|nr:hypothetical protein BJ508DRAFT_360880 [Ascobolus immersus RN42]